MLDPTQQGAIKAFTSRDFFRPQPFQPQQQTTLPGASSASQLPPGFGSTQGAASSLVGAVGDAFGGGSAAGAYPIGGSLGGGGGFQLPTSLPGQGTSLQLPGYAGDSLISGGYNAPTMGSHPQAPSWLNDSPLSGRTYGRYEGGVQPVQDRLWGNQAPPSQNPHTPFSPGDVRLPPGGVYAPLTPQPPAPRPPQLPPAYQAPREPGTTFSLPTGFNSGRSTPTYRTSGTGY